MTEQDARQTALQAALHLLVQNTGLTAAEISRLRLPHLHLAGRHPSIQFTPTGSSEPKTVELDIDVHRALVGWLVARPDVPSDFLFPGEGANPMPAAEIEALVEKVKPAGGEKPPAEEAPSPEAEEPGKEDMPGAGTVPPEPAVLPEEEGLPPLDQTLISRFRPERPAPPPPLTRPEPPPFRPEPPPFRPESGPVAPGPAPRPPKLRETGTDMPLPDSRPPRPPEPVTEEAPVPPATEKPAPAGPSPEVPPAEASPAAEKPAVPPPESETGAEPAVGPRRRKVTTAAEAAAEAGSELAGRLTPRQLALAAAVVVLVPCLLCAAGGWWLWQSDAGTRLAASLGLVDLPTPTATAAVVVTPTPTSLPEAEVSSPLPTPTLPPTPTPTETPAPPTSTPTPIPTDTPVPTAPPTDTPTPAPTDTATPTATATPEPPSGGAPAPTPTPTSSIKYDAPKLLEPENNYNFIKGNIIVLRWEPVGQLAPDEQYAVRLIYRYQGQVTYGGANIKEAQWEVPQILYDQVDGPDKRFEWFVQVERLNDDGSGTPVSPESEHWFFTWK